MGIKEADYEDAARHKSGKKFFVYAPPFYGRRSRATGELLSARARRIEPAFVGAETWQNSVYYFWWEFLRRHDGYKRCCERGGQGAYSQLYADFGNVHVFETANFWKWWSERVSATQTRGEMLFAEPTARSLEVLNGASVDKAADTLVVAVPLEVRTS